MLGLPWNKEKGMLTVLFPHNQTPSTKRGVLSKLAKVYDTMGLASQLTLGGTVTFASRSYRGMLN